MHDPNELHHVLLKVRYTSKLPDLVLAAATMSEEQPVFVARQIDFDLETPSVTCSARWTNKLKSNTRAEMVSDSAASASDLARSRPFFVPSCSLFLQFPQIVIRRNLCFCSTPSDTKVYVEQYWLQYLD